MSSGNLDADRRFAYAQGLRQDGDHAAAADVFAQALELAPGWAEGHFALAEAQADAGQRDNAVDSYRTYLALDAADSMGAGVRLHLLGAATRPHTLSGAYVRRLFDEYAARFDQALVHKLNYRAPQLLRAALGERHFQRAFDLGCGTGLTGEAIRELCTWLGGVDLSPAMTQAAARKAIYDSLEPADMLAALKSVEPCDLMIAGDVLVYCGDLAPIFTAVRAKVTADGVFAFTLQRSEGEDYVLGTEHRFSHARDYVMRVAQETGFALQKIEDVVCRQEKGLDVPGLLVVLNPKPTSAL